MSKEKKSDLEKSAKDIVEEMIVDLFRERINNPNTSKCQRRFLKAVLWLRGERGL